MLLFLEIYKIVSKKNLENNAEPAKGPGAGQQITLVASNDANKGAASKNCC